MVERVETKIAKALMSVIAMGLFSLTVLAVLQVVTRYFVDVTIIWIEEVSIYILSWMAAAGGPWMWLKEGHIRMDVLNVYLPQTILYGMDLFINLMGIVMGIALVRTGWITIGVNKGYTLSIIGIDEGFRYYPLVFCGVLFSVCAALELAEQLNTKREVKP